MRSLSKLIWGILFLIFGILLAGKILGIIHFNFFFRGWWTIFIIVPGIVGLTQKGKRPSSFFQVGIGVLLLLSSRNLMQWEVFSKLVVSLVFVTIGISFFFQQEKHEKTHRKKSDHRRDEKAKYQKRQEEIDISYNATTPDNGNNVASKTNHNGNNNFTSLFSSNSVQFVDEPFTGAVITSILGTIRLDLRNAIIEKDVVVDITCILGGIDIFVPGNVKVIVSCLPIMGGVESKIRSTVGEDSITVYIRGTCILGGVEIK